MWCPRLPFAGSQRSPRADLAGHAWTAEGPACAHTCGSTRCRGLRVAEQLVDIERRLALCPCWVFSVSSMGTHRIDHWAHDRAPTFVMHRPPVSRIARDCGRRLWSQHARTCMGQRTCKGQRALPRVGHTATARSACQTRAAMAPAAAESRRHGACVMTNGSVRALWGWSAPPATLGPGIVPLGGLSTRSRGAPGGAPPAERASARARRAAVISRGARVFPGARARPRRPQSIPTFKIDPLLAKDI